MEIMNFFAQSEGLDVMLMFVGLFGLILVVIYLLSGIKIIKEWERAPVLRLGRYTGLKGPGVFWIIPGIDKIPSVISTRIQTYSFRSEQSLT
ncbi:MAG: SPFH domain-containing protein, partial [Candidatus Hodarchaeales archaeon]